MYANYIYKIERDSSFFAGYNICSLTGDNHPIRLYTSLRIMKVTQGRCEWKIGTKTYMVEKGDILVVNNIEPRQISKTFNTNFVCDVFGFSPVVFGNNTECFSLFFNRTKNFNPIINKNIKNVDDINYMLDILKKQFIKQVHSKYTKDSISSLITAICALILDMLNQESTDIKSSEYILSTAASEMVARSISYIYENSGNHINVSDLAANVSVSREYFSKIFHKYTGSTPSTFITQCKINNVIRLINTKNINILDAAIESGFNTSSGFYQAFHTMYGMSPKKFLKSIHEEERNNIKNIKRD